MKTLPKSGLLTASLVLVGVSVMGCGSDSGSGGAPTDATTAEFCDTLTGVFSDPQAMIDATPEELVAEVKTWAKDLGKVGTPEDIPAEARDGFDLLIEEVAALEADAELGTLEESLSGKDKDASVAFNTYSTDTCGSVLDNQDLPEVPAPS
ncbi:MAG: hypothetical protein ABIR39_09295 [Nocardioides sp.]|uniref:hypothetical protein n=1 Tax=Nocardioides sp. TaxID=35761 RepID=UPI00326551C6